MGTQPNTIVHSLDLCCTTDVTDQPRKFTAPYGWVSELTLFSGIFLSVLFNDDLNYSDYTGVPGGMCQISEGCSLC